MCIRDRDNLVKYFNGPQKLMAKLVDGFGNPIANATVYFTINGKTYVVDITDSVATLKTVSYTHLNFIQ